MPCRSRILLLILVLCGLGACASPAATPSPPLPVEDANPPPLPGGYSPLAQDDPNVINAAQFAVTARGQQDGALSLQRVLKAEQQVVNGTNYRLCLSLRQGDAIKTAEAVVYRSRQQDFSLSGWEWKTCP